jgi:excisionase family DNA binding protein
MSKKYLSLEEAAEILGLSTTDLNRLREKGSIRAFADRGTWKFKEEDVVTLKRSRQEDSDQDLPLVVPADDSSVLDGEDVLGSQPTVIRKGVGEDSSDSDVRLIFDENVKGDGSGSSVLDQSDSDVKLMSSPSSAVKSDSDSDVKLAGTSSAIFDPSSDSDVKLVTDESSISETSGSDSDVRLVSSESSGEIKMTGSSDDIMPVVEEGSSVVGDDSAMISSDSGISLGDSGLALVSDSGISLESPADSGISLSEEPSILLEADSGISLAGDATFTSDSGIALAGDMTLKSDSGMSLAPDTKTPAKKDAGKKAAGKKPQATQADDDLGATVPMMAPQSGEDEDLLDTAMEVPSLSDSSESQDLFGSSSGETTNVITLDDEEEDSAGYDVTAEISAEGAVDEEEVVAAEDDEEPVEISDDLVGEDDELADDVFGADDEDFADDELESGESSAELPVAPRGMVAVAEQEWGTGVHVTLILTMVLTLLCGVVMFDLVRNMWHTDAANHNPMSTVFVDMFKDM